MNHSLQHDSKTTSHDVSEHPSRTALVLGGGGSAGNAWLIGVIAGLFDAGLDVTGADLIIGTSAGSTAAAQITGATPAELLADILAAAPQPRTAPAGSDRGRVPIRPATNQMETNERESSPPLRMRPTCAAEWVRRRSRWMRRRTVPGKRSGAPPSPLGCPVSAGRNERMLITAVDAHTGEPVVFDRHSGVDLVDAVAASCASGFAYSIGDSRYIDGGYRSNAENADLAAGYARVLVLSPFGGRSRTPVDWGMHLATQVDELRARGSRVETIFPDGNSRSTVRRQRDGSVDASARRTSRIRPRQSPRRAAHRILALTAAKTGRLRGAQATSTFALSATPQSVI